MKNDATGQASNPQDLLTRQRLQYRAPRGRGGVPVGTLPSVRVRIHPEHQGPMAELMRDAQMSVPEIVYDALELLFRLPPHRREQLLLEADGDLEQADPTRKELVS